MNNPDFSAVLLDVLTPCSLGEHHLEWKDLEKIVRKARETGVAFRDEISFKASRPKGVTRERVEQAASQVQDQVLGPPVVLVEGLHIGSRCDVKFTWRGIFPDLPYLFSETFGDKYEPSGMIADMRGMRRIVEVCWGTPAHPRGRGPGRIACGRGQGKVTFWSDPWSYYWAHSVMVETQWGPEPTGPLLIPDACDCRACRPDRWTATVHSDKVLPVRSILERM